MAMTMRASASSLSIEWRSWVGRVIVTPSAIPVGMIVTLWTGSFFGRIAAHRAWPASWYAVRSSSSRLRTIEPRSMPSRARSRAESKSTASILSLPRRTAKSAASLTRLARSAPAIPGVPRAITLTSTSSPVCLPFRCTPRIFTRSSSSGSGTTTWRSKRPARAGRDRGCRAGWWPPSSQCPRSPRSRPSRRASG